MIWPRQMRTDLVTNQLHLFHLFYQEGEKYNLGYSNWEDFLIGLQQ